MKNDYAGITKGTVAYDSFGVTVTVLDYSQSLHAATVQYSDGSTKWVAAETLTILSGVKNLG